MKTEKEIKADKKQVFIQELAHFLVDNQVGKSILLQVEANLHRPPGCPIMIKEWAHLRSVSGLFGYPDFEEAVRQLTDILS